MPLLGRRIGRVQEIAETSASAMDYEIRLNSRFGNERELDFVTPPNVVLPPPASRKSDAQKDLFSDLEARQTKEAAN